MKGVMMWGEVGGFIVAMMVALAFLITWLPRHETPTTADFVYGCAEFFNGELKYVHGIRACVVNGTAYELIYYPKNDSLALGGEIPW